MANNQQSEGYWRENLTVDQFNVCRKKGTESAFTGKYTDNKEQGVYSCVCCGEALFDSESQYHSGSGWPSFWSVINTHCIDKISDKTHGMQRVEIVCHACQAHLGHLFEDGPQPTGLRYCINSIALKFKQKI